MKRVKIVYWTFTGLLAGFMLLGSIPDVLRVRGAIEMFEHLGYPSYLLPFVGVAKILGVTAIVIPAFQKLKEWAYAGLVFDLMGAVYSHLSVGDTANWMVPVIGLVLVGGSYVSYRKRVVDPDCFREPGFASKVCEGA